MSSHSNENDLMQLALYMIPRYMKRIKKYNRRYMEENHEGHSHGHEDQPFIDEKKLIDFLKDNLMEKKDIEHLNKKNNPQGDDLIKKGKEKAKDIIDKAIDADIKEEKTNNTGKPNKSNEAAGIKKAEDINKKNYTDTKINNYYISDFLANFYGKPIKIEFKYSVSNSLDNVLLVYSDEALVKIQNSDNKIFVIPFNNITGIYLKDYLPESQLIKTEIDSKPVKKTMEDYFKSISNKKISIEIINNEKAKFIHEAVIKKVYDNFIMLDNSSIISIGSIILIEELFDKN
ncbi:hypothetical protein J2Z42_000370 [Clostridium algifaecis]|uniref:Uncharacterized protein n=1 Tax=Clostridium algifaecis TaxID=1472040 RepID=A0ABS4KNV2_9CLOT|nr:hypothetical protein [Clostridium algifaecis]MBP2031705.1 hypothetical protein [Clostridium algifaecis]